MGRLCVQGSTALPHLSRNGGRAPEKLSEVGDENLMGMGGILNRIFAFMNIGLALIWFLNASQMYHEENYWFYIVLGILNSAGAGFTWQRAEELTERT